MSQPWRDPRYPLLCFCSTWNCLMDPDEMTPEEYAQRKKMMNDIARGKTAPDNLVNWHGVSVCPKGPHA